ncbi:hypothetical protein B9Z55_007929 [Caenorhabditis nigoni]|uniref:BTB domain-containing protein n=1 Tax=Caenorhabditis nigoni TaxID=1611254 RepID=A0A2G5VBV2_9PELO|nr:hypothetical protein B9Z55_007929 [Caenorhabditis nigoni]
MSNNKEFSIFQVFDKLSNLNNGARTDGDAVKRFGVCWKIQLYKYSDGDVFPLLICENSEAGDWSINTTCDVTVGGKPFKTGVQFEFKQSKAILDPSYISRSLFSHYQIDGTAVIEYRVTINRMTGIEIPKVRKFDDDVAKESSDVVLMVENQQFHVNKMYLSLHSTYFKSLFSGNFEESGKSEIELKDIDSSVFHDFLEVLYREPSIDENNCFGILKLADMYDAKTAVRRCEDYLIKISQKSLHEKFEAATQYKLEELTEKCIFGMKTRIEICSVMPKDPSKIESWAWKKLVEKSLSIS